MTLTVLASLLLIYFGESSCDSEELSAPKLKLIFAQVLFRHGDRAPGSTYPTDPHSSRVWPMGLEQLTQKGMRQQYWLGKYLRKRYGKKLLNKQYIAKEIYVRSTGKDRALQSAASNLAGLYPPRKYEIWNPAILWQPIPVHSMPLEDDYILHVSNPCPKYDVVFLNQSKDIIEKYNKRHAGFFDYVKRHSGLKELDLMSIGDIYDPLFCESQHKLQLPQWTRELVNETAGTTVYDLIVGLKTVAKNLKYNSDEKALLTGGPLLGEIVNRMINMTNGRVNWTIDRDRSAESPKMVMYSAHDDTVMALLYSLNVVQRPFLVPYTTTVFVDLYREWNGDYSAQVSVLVPELNAEKTESRSNETSSDEVIWNSRGRVRHVRIPGCPGFRCPLRLFAEVLSQRIIYPIWKRSEYCGIKQCPTVSR